jgi:hypothetical protein
MSVPEQLDTSLPVFLRSRTTLSVMLSGRAPCYSLIPALHDVEEATVPQGFLAFLRAGSLFNLKITLITAK